MKFSNWLRFLLPLLILNILFLLILSSTPMVFFPEEGVWYCEQLQIQISCEQPEDCWILSNGEKIQCTWGSDRGSKWMSVSSQDRTTGQFKLGQEVLGENSFLSRKTDWLFGNL